MAEETTESERDALSLAARPAASYRATRDLPTPAPRAAPGARLPRRLGELAAEVARERGVSVNELISRRRHPELVLARVEIARRALREGAATLTQVARHVGRAPSTLSDLLRGGRYGGLPKP